MPEAHIDPDEVARVPLRHVVFSIVGLWICYFVLITARSSIVGLDLFDELLWRRALAGRSLWRLWAVASGAAVIASFAGLIASDLDRAFMVALVHSAATLAGGGLCAGLTFRYLGLRGLRSAWWNIEVVWGASLVLVGAVSLGTVH